MNRKLSFSVDDEYNDIVKRYEQFLSGTATGYFDVEELESIVEYYLKRGRTKDCNKVLELGLQLHPNNNALKTKRAKIYLFLGEDQKASRILDKLTETSDYEVMLLKIEVLVKMDRMPEAQTLADIVLSEATDEVDSVCLDIAYIYLGHANYDEALNLLEKGDIRNKKNVELLYELAFCYEQAEEFEKAISTYNRILNIEPYSDEAWFNMGQVYFTMQDFAKALEAYEFALTIDETDSLTVLQKAHVHFQLDQFEPAIEAYIDYKRMTANVWQTEIFIGECYEKMERYDEAIAYYRMSLEAYPQNYDALTGIGICLLEQELYVECKSYIERAIELEPEAPDAWVYLAEAFIGLDETDKALEAYQRSISYDVEQPDTLMAIANIYLENNELDDALFHYIKAFTLDESLEFVCMFIAVTYFKMGNLQAAIPYLKIALLESDQAASLFLELCPEAIETLFLDKVSES